MIYEEMGEEASEGTSEGSFGLQENQRKSKGIHFQRFADVRGVWIGGMNIPVPPERLPSLHKTQEQKHPLQPKVLADA